MDYSQRSFDYRGLDFDDRFKTEPRAYQAETIEWMIWKERNPYFGMNGGLLLSEVGLGKTLTTLYTALLSGGTTLIICPALLVQTWCDELRKHTTVLDQDIYVHLGSGRQEAWLKRPRFLQDQILTAFMLSVNTYFATALPDSLIRAVKAEITMTVKNQTLPKFVLSSYTTMQHEMEVVNNPVTNQDMQIFKGNSIFARRFQRIVFDEAHNIRNHQTQTFCAAQQLCGNVKWFVTGTPIMNNTNEMFPYIKLLGGVASKQAFTRKYPATIGGTRELQSLLKFIAIRRTKEVLNLPPKTEQIVHVQMTDDEREFYLALRLYSSDRAHRLLNQYRALGYQERAERMRIISSVLLLLLRLRQSCCDPVLVINAMRRLRPHVHEGRVDIVAATAALKFYTENRKRTDEECGICMDDTATIISRNCGHKLCKDCWSRVLQARKCPTCRAPVLLEHLEDVKEDISFRDKIDVLKSQDELQIADRILSGELWRQQSSSKTKAILDLTEQSIAEGHRVLIASQFVQYLHCIQESFRQRFAGRKCVVLTGKDRPAVRQAYVKEFQDDDSIDVCFASLGSSGEGITLTGASRVIIADLFWNGAKTHQLQGRVSRLGQLKEVVVSTMVVENSVELKILELVRKKNKICQMITEGRAVTQDDRHWMHMAVNLLS